MIKKKAAFDKVIAMGKRLKSLTKANLMVLVSYKKQKGDKKMPDNKAELIKTYKEIAHHEDIVIPSDSETNNISTEEVDNNGKREDEDGKMDDDDGLFCVDI